ncbi:hypothetical protein LTR85_000706 [Meristemomyces frigidus]|nr:hypothetical protein LTR85_000706 [Meristemomyces frigidus]
MPLDVPKLSPDAQCMHSAYVDYLTCLAEIEPAKRPIISQHRKLRAILGQRGVQGPLQQMRTRYFHSADAWNRVEWHDAERNTMVNAIAQLELGVVDFVPGSNEEARQSNMRDFLGPLFQAGRLPGPLIPPHASHVDLAGDAHAQSQPSIGHFSGNGRDLRVLAAHDRAMRSQAPAIGGSLVQMDLPALPPNTPQPLTLSAKGKRPRSYYSGAIASDRRPLSPGVNTGTSQQQGFGARSEEISAGVQEQPHAMQPGHEISTAALVQFGHEPMAQVHPPATPWAQEDWSNRSFLLDEDINYMEQQMHQMQGHEALSDLNFYDVTSTPGTDQRCDKIQWSRDNAFHGYPGDQQQQQHTAYTLASPGFAGDLTATFYDHIPLAAEWSHPPNQPR